MVSVVIVLSRPTHAAMATRVALGLSAAATAAHIWGRVLPRLYPSRHVYTLTLFCAWVCGVSCELDVTTLQRFAACSDVALYMCMSVAVNECDSVGT